MEVLVCLAQHAGEPVAKEQLLQTVWSETFVGDDVLKRSIVELRRVFEDDVNNPKFIQTITKRGYRLIANVEWVDAIPPGQPKSDNATASGARSRWLWIVGSAATSAALMVALGGVFDVGGLRTWLRAGGVPEIHSLAVLPLRNLSSDPNQEYFSDGLTDGLITDLAQISSLKVISHTSTMQYKDVKKALPEIARDLNVDGIVEGTVQRSGDRVRITVQLIHGASDKHLWAHSYEGNMSDVLALERDVTEETSRQIRAQLVTQKQMPLQRPRLVNPKSLDAYLEGIYHLNRYGEGPGEEVLKKAAEYFQQAIDADPTFAPAYIGLADAHGQLIRASSEDVAIERRAAEKAVELDPNYADARINLGFLDWQPGLDWRGAEEQFRRAITLSPNNALAHDQLGILLVAEGRTREGLQESQVAQQLDPKNDHLSLVLYWARDYDASVRVVQRILREDPNNGISHCLLWGVYFKKGSYAEAINELAECYSLYGYSKIGSNLRQAFANSGYQGAMRQFARDVEHLQDTNQAYLPGNLVIAYMLQGNKDRAFYWLEQAYEHREMVGIDGGVYFLGCDPMFDPLRSDPRFKDMLRRVGLPP